MNTNFIKIFTLALAALCIVHTPLEAQDNRNVTFIGVALDGKTKLADEKLREYLSSKTALEFETREMEYGVAINTLVNWKAEEQGPVMARVTPYVYVVAEMLGADLEILGTYLSKKTGKTTYNSYFVVKKSFYSGKVEQGNFVQHLKNLETPAKFIYHDKFSTSSYFLPSLYFRQNKIFSIRSPDADHQKFIAIQSSKAEGISSSTGLVSLIQHDQADFAAVWDGTKIKFDNDPDLLFMQLPYAIPNDLLVFSKSKGKKLKKKILKAINEMQTDEIDVGDFLKWIDFQHAPLARKSLASLRWLAKVPPPPVTVKIRRDHNDALITEKHLEAAKQALRLSGTELILYDDDYHKTFDVLWTLKKTHDNSLIISSEFVAAGIKQEFPISFKNDDMVSLTSRIGHIIANRMHRIRYIWPYDNEKPRVLRDVDFTLPANAAIKAQKITWIDYNKNEYIIDSPFDVKALKSDFNSFQLESDGFPKLKNGNKYDFDPMSNVAYRVFLIRTTKEKLLIQVFTVSLVTLFALAAFFAVRAATKKEENI